MMNCVLDVNVNFSGSTIQEKQSHKVDQRYSSSVGENRSRPPGECGNMSSPSKGSYIYFEEFEGLDVADQLHNSAKTIHALKIRIMQDGQQWDATKKVDRLLCDDTNCQEENAKHINLCYKQEEDVITFLFLGQDLAGNIPTLWQSVREDVGALNSLRQNSITGFTAKEDDESQKLSEDYAKREKGGENRRVEEIGSVSACFPFDGKWRKELTSSYNENIEKHKAGIEERTQERKLLREEMEKLYRSQDKIEQNIRRKIRNLDKELENRMGTLNGEMESLEKQLQKTEEANKWELDILKSKFGSKKQKMYTLGSHEDMSNSHAMYEDEMTLNSSTRPFLDSCKSVIKLSQQIEWMCDLLVGLDNLIAVLKSGVELALNAERDDITTPQPKKQVKDKELLQCTETDLSLQEIVSLEKQLQKTEEADEWKLDILKIKLGSKCPEEAEHQLPLTGMTETESDGATSILQAVHTEKQELYTLVNHEDMSNSRATYEDDMTLNRSIKPFLDSCMRVLKLSQKIEWICDLLVGLYNPTALLKSGVDLAPNKELLQSTETDLSSQDMAVRKMSNRIWSSISQHSAEEHVRIESRDQQKKATVIPYSDTLTVCDVEPIILEVQSLGAEQGPVVERKVTRRGQGIQFLTDKDVLIGLKDATREQVVERITVERSGQAILSSFVKFLTEEDVQITLKALGKEAGVISKSRREFGVSADNSTKFNGTMSLCEMENAASEARESREAGQEMNVKERAPMRLNKPNQVYTKEDVSIRSRVPAREAAVNSNIVGCLVLTREDQIDVMATIWVPEVTALAAQISLDAGRGPVVQMRMVMMFRQITHPPREKPVEIRSTDLQAEASVCSKSIGRELVFRENEGDVTVAASIAGNFAADVQKEAVEKLAVKYPLPEKDIHPQTTTKRELVDLQNELPARRSEGQNNCLTIPNDPPDVDTPKREQVLTAHGGNQEGEEWRMVEDLDADGHISRPEMNKEQRRSSPTTAPPVIGSGTTDAGNNSPEVGLPKMNGKIADAEIPNTPSASHPLVLENWQTDATTRKRDQGATAQEGDDETQNVIRDVDAKEIQTELKASKMSSCDGSTTSTTLNIEYQQITHGLRKQPNKQWRSLSIAAPAHAPTMAGTNDRWIETLRAGLTRMKQTDHAMDTNIREKKNISGPVPAEDQQTSDATKRDQGVGVHGSSNENIQQREDKLAEEAQDAPNVSNTFSHVGSRTRSTANNEAYREMTDRQPRHPSGKVKKNTRFHEKRKVPLPTRLPGPTGRGTEWMRRQCCAGINVLRKLFECGVVTVILKLLIIVSILPCGLADGPCRSPQHLQLGSTGVVNCAFHEHFPIIVWFDSTNTRDHPLVTTNNNRKYGRGLSSGEFDIDENGSLIIWNVSLRHERSFCVAILTHPNSAMTTHCVDVETVVLPEQRNPLITNVGNCSESVCFAQYVDDSVIRCSVEDTRPAVNLTWAVRSGLTDQSISHQSSQVPSLSITGKFSSFVMLVNPFMNSKTLALTVCKANSQPNLLNQTESLLLLQNMASGLPHVAPVSLYAVVKSTVVLNCPKMEKNILVWNRGRGDSQEMDMIAYAIFSESPIVFSSKEMYTLYPNGSLLISEVSVETRGTYICLAGNGEHEEARSYDVDVYAPAYPQVEGCESRNYCVLLAEEHDRLTCTIRSVPKGVRLGFTPLSPQQALITFLEQVVEIRDVGDYVDMSVTTTYQASGSGISVFQCGVIGEHKELFSHTAVFSLHIEPAIRTPTPEMNVESNRHEMILIISVMFSGLLAGALLIWIGFRIAVWFKGRDMVIEKNREDYQQCSPADTVTSQLPEIHHKTSERT